MQMNVQACLHALINGIQLGFQGPASDPLLEAVRTEQLVWDCKAEKECHSADECSSIFKVYDEPESPNEGGGGMFNVYDEQEPPNVACLRCMVPT